MRAVVWSGLRIVLVAAALASLTGAGAGRRVRAVFQSGTPAPPGLTFASLGRAATNSRGSLCFLSGWDGVQRRREGLYLLREGQVSPIARTGDPLPGGVVGRFSFPVDRQDEYDSFALNDRDEVAFVTRQGLFLSSDRGLRAVARLGDELNGAAEERWEEIRAVSLSSAGTLAFVGSTRLTVEGERQEGIFLSRGDSLEITYFVGDTVPGLDAELAGFDGVALNDRGDMAVLARVGDKEQPVILLSSGEETQVIAVEGGMAPGGRWTGLDSVALNVQGTLLFLGHATDGVREWPGIYAATDGVVTPLAVPGQPVEGAGEAVIGQSLGRPVIDDNGDAAFLADLAGPQNTQGLVIATGQQLVAATVSGGPEQEAPVARLTGLNQGSLRGGRVVCGVTLAGAAEGDALKRFGLSAGPETVLPAGTPLPDGSALVTVDDESAPRETEARLTAGGDVVFAADVGGYGRALFLEQGDGPKLLTPLGRRRADGLVLRSVASFGVNGEGQLCFLGHLDEEGRQVAVFQRSLQNEEVPRVVMRTGDALPGVEGQVVRQFGPPSLDGQGRVIVTAYAARADAPPDAPLDGYLIRIGGGGPELLAGEGTVVTGAGLLMGRAEGGVAATLPGTFREVQVNRAGQALFISTYLDPRTGALMPSGLFLLENGAVRPVALFGQPSPVAGGLPYFSFSAPRLADDGTISFVASVLEQRRRQKLALFRVQAGVTTAVAVAGNIAPELDGAQYRTFLEPALSPLGELAFLSVLDGATPARGSGAVYLSSGPSVRLALAESDRDGAPDLPVLRMDGAAPAAPMDVAADGSLLVAARPRGENQPAGLYFVDAP
jgi:hypothetical protein